MEDEVAPSLSKTDLGKTEMDKDVVEEVPPLKAETNDETKVNDPTERPSPPEEQTEPLQQSSEDQEQMEVTQPNVDQETTSGELEQLNVKQEMSFEEQEQPSTHEELVIGEGDIPHVDQEQTQEEKEQKSRSQEQLLEQLSGDQGMITEEHLADQEEQVIGEQVHGDQTEPDIVQEQQSTSQEQPLELQEQLGGDPSSIIHKQSGQIVIQEEQVIREQVHLDHEQPITERKQVLDKQEQTFVFEEQSLAEDTVAASLQKNTRRTQNILEFQKTLSQDAINNATATVKIMVVPDGHVVTMAFPIGFTAAMLKEYFASQLKIPQMVIQIMFEGKIVEDAETLMDLGVRPHGTIQLEMLSTDQDNYPIKAIKPQHEYNMPDVITVKVQTDYAAYQDVVVEIERLTFHKPYLGGYKHKLTGAEFHHAGTQTVPKKRPDKGIEVFCRDTQTVETKNKHQQSRNITSTQMTKIGCYVANFTDKLIEPKLYTTAAEYHARRLKAVIVIQTYYRRLSAKRLVEELRKAKLDRLEWECQEELRKKKEKEDRLRREHERRMNPKTKEDFEILYHALEMWRQEEIERINNTLTGAERKAALCAILEQETHMIASIERYKQDANVENHREAIQSFLAKCSQPKKWKAFDGKTTQMYTQYTIRARELRDIYSSINIKHLTPDERLDALLTLKQTVKEHDCKLTQEIVELIDREADLLMRGVQDCNLEGLRKRISTLFLQYIKTPVFNPEVARLLKVPQDPAVLCKNIYFCPSCKSYLPSTEFSLSANARTVGRCRQCAKLDNQARHREDFSKYKFILKQLKKSEADYKDEARIAFLLQEQDIQYLVDNIWAAQSILSAWDDLYDLVMARWDKYLEWAPWNCILLKKVEAEAHLKLNNAEQAYGVTFIRKVKHKHTLAKNYFSQIPEMAPFLHGDLSHCKHERNDLLTTKPIAAASHA